MPADNYEFTEPQNKTITELANAMGFVGLLMMILGVLSALVGAGNLVMSVVSHAAHASAGVQQLIQGVLYLVIGGWLRKAAGAFTNIVKTQGRDISNLMVALDELRKMFVLQRVLWIISLVLVVLAFFVGVAFGIAGKSLPGSPAAPAMTAPAK